MEGRGWLETVPRFQARARGYVVRKEIGGAQQEFEDIVRDIDGDLDHLDWRGGIVPIPHFKDIDGPLHAFNSCARKHLTVGAHSESHSVQQSGDRVVTPHALSESIEPPERDDSHRQGQAVLSSPPGGDREPGGSQSEQAEEGAVMESTDTTTVWSSLGLDTSYSPFQKGPQGRCLAHDIPQTPQDVPQTPQDITQAPRDIPQTPQDVPQTPQDITQTPRDAPQAPQALRLHRNTLTMELLWLQQAIASRKKYLLLKERLNMS